MNDNNLPLNMDEQESNGTITYANEVIAIIAGMAMSEVDGVAGHSTGKSVSQYLGIGKGSKGGSSAVKGVRVDVGSEETSVDLTLSVEYGKPIQKVCTQVQENVRKAIESMTGLHVVKVDVHVTSVIFEKEEQAKEPLKELLTEKPAAAPVKEPVQEIEQEVEEELEIETEIEEEIDAGIEEEEKDGEPKTDEEV